MKKLLLILPLLIVYNLLGLVLLQNNNRPSTKTSPVSTKTQVNLQIGEYLEDKGVTDNAPEFSFGDLVAYAEPAILGVSTPPSPHKDTYTDSASIGDEKDSYTVALFGDSMIDTLGTALTDVGVALSKQFPDKIFTLYNYGAGGENIEAGITRLTNSYTYLGQQKPSLLSIKPDVVVIESFAYNHWTDSQSDIDRHWLAIAKSIETIKRYDPNIKIVLAATIAPYCPTYTDGSANLPPERKLFQCQTVKKYLDNMYRFATSQNYPLANAFHESLLGDGNGAPTFINQTDHIHYSEKGRTLFANEVAEAIAQVL